MRASRYFYRGSKKTLLREAEHQETKKSGIRTAASIKERRILTVLCKKEREERGLRFEDPKDRWGKEHAGHFSKGL